MLTTTSNNTAMLARGHFQKTIAPHHHILAPFGLSTVNIEHNSMPNAKLITIFLKIRFATFVKFNQSSVGSFDMVKNLTEVSSLYQQHLHTPLTHLIHALEKAMQKRRTSRAKTRLLCVNNRHPVLLRRGNSKCLRRATHTVTPVPTPPNKRMPFNVSCLALPAHCRLDRVLESNHYKFSLSSGSVLENVTVYTAAVLIPSKMSSSKLKLSTK